MCSVISNLSEVSRNKFYDNVSTSTGLFKDVVQKSKLISYIAELFGEKYQCYKEMVDLKFEDLIKEMILQITTDVEYFWIKEHVNDEKGVFYLYLIEMYSYYKQNGLIPKFNSEKEFEIKNY